MRRVLLASPRGFCAGVDRAVETVRQALALWGAPVYVRRQIVHNAHVVAELECDGAVFVDSVSDVPPGAPVVFSAHGVAPAVRERARLRELTVVDATCPLVTKVHQEALALSAAGYRILLIGHAGHPEVVGTLGHAPAAQLVESAADAELVTVESGARVAYLTQTTLSVDDTARIVEVLERRFPGIVGPRKADICYATSNRQRAVKDLAAECDLVLVVGAANSSNSRRLVETARAEGTPAYLIEDETSIDERWLRGVETVGVTASASAPERLVRCVCEWFASRGVVEIRELGGPDESVTFGLPLELRRRAASTA